MKQVHIYLRDEDVIGYAVGSRSRDSDSVVEDIIVNGNKLYVYFIDGTYCLYCNLPFEYRGETKE